MRPSCAGLSWQAYAVISCAGVAAVLCALPAFSHAGSTDWPALLPLAALYALAEAAPRSRLLGRHIPRGTGPPEICGPVLLTACLLLPPEAAASVPFAGALLGPVAPRHTAARRIWHAAQLGLAVRAAAEVRRSLLGHRCLESGASGYGTPDSAATASPSGLPHDLTVGGLPAALLAAGVVALVFCGVLTALERLIRWAAEGGSGRAARRGPFAGGLAPGLVHGLAALLMAVLWRSQYGLVAALFVLLPMCLCCWVFAQYHRERAAHQATVRALVQAVDIKDRYTRGHSERVGRASVLIARELGMNEERTEMLRFAGILHDIGKLGVPTRLLRKDGPLTPPERRVIELHPEYGQEMVRGIGFLGEARSAILHHHERLDGSGYPYGLAGAQIPEPARVVAVADAFDAMTSTRSYRRARPVPDATAELRRCAGSQFDGAMVEALCRALERHGWSPAVTADQPKTEAPAAPPGPHAPAAVGTARPSPRPAERSAAPAVRGPSTACSAGPGRASAGQAPVPGPADGRSGAHGASG